MSIHGKMKYYAVKRKNPKTGAIRYAPQIYLYSHIDKEQILDGAVRNSSIPRAYLSMTFDALVQEVKNYVMNGHSVTLEGFGTISATLSSRPSETSDDVSSLNVKKFKLNYRPAPKIRNYLRPWYISWEKVEKVKGNYQEPSSQS